MGGRLLHNYRARRRDAGCRRIAHLLHITASPSQSVMLNSAVCPVVAGQKFTWTMQARVAPRSVGSGYWELFFLGGKGEVGRKKIPLEPAAFATGETHVDVFGVFPFSVSDPPEATFLIEARYPGDDRHLPGRATIMMER